MSYGYTPNEQASNMAVADSSNILVEKRTILSNPGTKLDSLYPNALNTIVDIAQNTWTQGRYQQSLSSLQFGGQSTILIPNGSFVATVYLHLELPALAANMAVNRGWGFAAIESISFLLGSSNVPQITLQGQTIYQLMLAQCESVMKRSEMLALAGQESFGSASAVSQSCDLILPLPFSVFAGRDSPFPFDTNLLQNPITINVNLAPARKFISGVGLASWQPQAFTKGTISLKLGDLLNKDQGLKQKMQQNPSLIMGYPFYHFQSYQTSFRSVSGSLGVSVNLQSFINADLLGIMFGVMPAINQAPATTGDIINPLIYEEVTDVQCLFNGLVMHSTPGQSHKLTGMNTVNDPIYIQQSKINLPAVAGTGPFTSSPVNVYPVFIDFDMVRSMCFHKEYSNVWRIANNTLTLNFKTPNLADDTPCVLYASYYYNGIANVKGGETEIFFS